MPNLYQQACQRLWDGASGMETLHDRVARALVEAAAGGGTGGLPPEVVAPIRELAAATEWPVRALFEALADLRPRVEDKAVKVGRRLAARQRGGVVYTPLPLVREVLRRTLGPLLDGLSPRPDGFGHAVVQLRILDPAVGSGRFLSETVRLLCDRIVAHPTPGSPPPGTGSPRQRWERAVVRHCVFGADRSPLAVQVARASLASAFDLFAKELAPHIVHGDSLVGVGPEGGAMGRQAADRWVDEQRRRARAAIREARVRPEAPLVAAPALHWPVAFPEILRGGGFDAVVGNPPYRSLDRLPSEASRLLQQVWPAIWMGQADLYYFFFVRGVELCRPGGRLGFVTSRYYLESRFARGLRGFLAREAAVEQVVDFRNRPLFEGASVDGAITILARSTPQGPVQVERPQEAPILAPARCLRPEGWVFLQPEVEAMCRRIDGDHPTLGALCLVGKGIETGANRIFEVNGEQAEALGLCHRTLRGVLKGSEIQPLKPAWNDRYWIYLEKTEEAELKEALPKVYAHLDAHRARLENRIAYRRGQCRWYRYSYPRHLHRYPLPKLLCPYLARRNRFTIDPDGTYLSSTDSLIISPRDDLPEWVLYYLGALLNSQLLTFRYGQMAKLKGGGLLSYQKRPVQQLPIPAPTGRPARRIAEACREGATAAELEEAVRALFRIPESLPRPQRAGTTRRKTAYTG